MSGMSGMSAEDAAAIIRRQQDAARPAIKEDSPGSVPASGHGERLTP
jgi:hypothetical protein